MRKMESELGLENVSVKFFQPSDYFLQLKNVQTLLVQIIISCTRENF